MNRTSVKLLLLLPLFSAIMFACEPVEPQEDPDEASASAISLALGGFDEIVPLVERAMEEADVNKTQTICATITADTIAKQITLDWGSGCVGLDGKFRSGIMYIQYNGQFYQTGSTFTIGFDNFSVQGTQLDGDVRITSFARNNLNQLFFQVEVIDGEVIFANGESILYETDRTYTLIEGEGNATVDDDVWAVDGVADGENQDGRGYNLVVDDPLIFKHSCTSTGNELPSAGAFTIKFRNLIHPLSLDFGDGDCDKTVVLTWRQRDYVLNL